MAGFVLKGISPGNHPFGNKSNFTGKLYSQGFYPSAGDSLYWKPNRRLLRDFLSLSLYDAQEKAKLNEEFFCMKPKRRLNSSGGRVILYKAQAEAKLCGEPRD